MLTVNEIFHSVQGESTRAGVRCVFVRLTACDLRCSWCDTPYAFHEGRKMSIQEVLETVASYECPTVELTGGEPLLQKDVYPLMAALIEAGHTVLIETGGHVNIGQVPGDVIKIVDVKCPGSGEAHRMDWDNLSKLAARDEVKFVIRDREDYEYARDVLTRHQLDRRCAAVLFSPVHGVLNARQLTEWVLADRLPVRVQLQVHKYIWDAQTRGV
jgi:7-carboxy-7-deazaguanine synthase